MVLRFSQKENKVLLDNYLYICRINRLHRLFMEPKLDIHFLEDATETMRAMAHPIRIAMIDLLHQNGKMSVTEIYETLEIEQAVASHHLRILKNKQVVTVQREQKFSLYSLQDVGYFEMINTLSKLLKK